MSSKELQSRLVSLFTTLFLAATTTTTVLFMKTVMICHAMLFSSTCVIRIAHPPGFSLPLLALSGSRTRPSIAHRLISFISFLLVIFSPLFPLFLFLYSLSSLLCLFLFLSSPYPLLSMPPPFPVFSSLFTVLSLCSPYPPTVVSS
jgi:hypothetical protein